MTSSAAWSAALVVAAAFMAGVARADVVVHDGGVERDRDAADLVLRQTGQEPRRVLAADVLSGPARLLASNARVEPCEGEPIALKVEPKLDSIVEAVLSFELARAIEELDVLDTLLPCSDAPVPAALLARLSFLRGAARFDQGDAEAATRELRDALAIDPGFVGLRGFPQPHLDLLEATRAEAAATPRPRGRLHLWTKPGDGVSLWVDGTASTTPPQEGVPVPAGGHLVQVVEESGRLRGMWVRTDGQDAVLVFSGAGPALWADGGRSAGGALGMRLLLVAEFEGRDGDVHVLRWKGRKVVSAQTFPPDGGPARPWEDLSVPEPEAPAAKAETNTGPSRLRFAVGGGYQHVQPFSYGMVALDVSVRVAGPVTALVFARPSHGGTFLADVGEEQPVRGGIVLVPFGAGIGAQKHDGAVGPFVFGVFQGAVNQVVPLGPFLAGAAVSGGADFAPGDGRLVVRVAGEVGFLGARDESAGRFAAAFTGRVWAGLGARF